MVRVGLLGIICAASLLFSATAHSNEAEQKKSTASAVASMPVALGGETLSTSIRNSKVFFCRQIRSYIVWNGIDRVWLHQNRPADKNGGWLGLVSASGDIAWQMGWEGQPPVPQKIWEDKHGRVLVEGKDQYDRFACIERTGFNLN